MNPNEPGDFYLVRYWATAGIQKVRGQIKNGYLVSRVSSYYQTFSKTYWAASLEEAIQKAEALRIKKITSLTKQIEKLKKLKLDGSGLD